MARSLCFAIVGCGRIAARHAAEIIKHGELVACCDILRDKTDAFSRQFSAKAYGQLDDLLTTEKNLDLISICSPNGLHPEHSIRSLRAGIHVLCEKPMAISPLDGQKMIEAATDAGKRLF